jgi:hypothetical protein
VFILEEIHLSYYTIIFKDLGFEPGIFLPSSCEALLRIPDIALFLASWKLQDKNIFEEM